MVLTRGNWFLKHYSKVGSRTEYTYFCAEKYSSLSILPAVKYSKLKTTGNDLYNIMAEKI